MATRTTTKTRTNSKSVKAHLMACTIRNIASRLRHDARDFGCRFPLQYADELEQLAEDYLKTK